MPTTARAVAAVEGTLVPIVRTRQAARGGRMPARAGAIALILGAHIPIVRARRAGHVGSTRAGHFIAGPPAFVEKTRIAIMELAASVEAKVGAITEDLIVAGREVEVRVRAHAARITDVLGAGVAVVGTCGARRQHAGVGRLVAAAAVAAAGAGITSMDGARPARARVRSVAEQAIVARVSVGQRRAYGRSS